MKAPSHADSFEVLCLQAASDGRGPLLFGDSLQRAREMGRAFMVGDKFPSVYLEFPLIGDPFLDVTVLYETLHPGTRIHSSTVAGTEAVLDWFSDTCDQVENVCFGFELDTKNPQTPAAAIHFQPRGCTELVQPFCEAAGEPERAQLYLNQNERMPEGWKLSFFGMFRGRPQSPLRVCGYLSEAQKQSCAGNARYLAEVFDTVGFTAYDDTMLDQVTSLMAVAPGTIDFQFDVYPDGSLGETFAIDAQFKIEQPEQVCQSFENGPAKPVMELLEAWGAADGRWKAAIDATFARGIPSMRDDGSYGKLAFTLMPQWVKARWRNGVLQQSKLYHLASASLLNADQ